MDWSQEKVLSFIQCYKNRPILWDPKHSKHYNKRKKFYVWAELAKEMNTPEDECRRKMMSLLASLRRERAKIAKSRRSGKGPGDIYVSNWFAYKPMAFLNQRKPHPNATSNIKYSQEIDENINEGFSENEEKMSSDSSVKEYENPTPLMKIKTDTEIPEEPAISTYAVLKRCNETTETSVRTMPDESESFGLFVWKQTEILFSRNQKR
ncbi:uncharacterized protein LOC115883585, partial [Sitophilus oryzae]|uniref:Uncharacterized protein LOC115883585 n=1 Tax=Sitophilus oryzae TaxID=7048 RepID=A0A6J2Y263_SITOR